MSGELLFKWGVWIALAVFGFLTVGTCSVGAGGCALLGTLFGG